MVIKKGEQMLADDILNLTFFPKGTILTFSSEAWNATSAEFRNIWKICDGTTSGVPNLKDKFLRGAAGSGVTGGADSSSITLTTNHLPTHNHGVTETAHNHTQNAHTHTHTQDSHTHGLWSDSSNDPTDVIDGLHNSNEGRIAKMRGGSNHTFSGTQNSSKTSTVTATNKNATATNIAAKTDISINNTGSGHAFTVATLPAYYTVIYIMKVA